MTPDSERTSADYFGHYAAPKEEPPEPPAPVPPPYRAPSPGSLAEIRNRVHSKLVSGLEPARLNDLAPDARRAEIRRLLDQILTTEGGGLGLVERRQLAEDLLDDVLGLGPLEKLLADPSVSDILVNGPRQVYVERNGVLEESPIHFRDSQHLLEIIRRIVSPIGRRVDESSPMVDARLPDGSRVNASVPPLALRGPSLSIRRFGKNPLRLEDLIRLKALTPEMAKFLEAAVRARLNVIVSGGTGSGKTTLLNVLSGFIPERERIVSVEDSAELQLQQRHVVQLETRLPNVEGKGEITVRQLVRNTLRMRPNRIIVGECRGAEALDMLQAMNTGHEGSMTTLHANSPRDAMVRLEVMLRMAGLRIPIRALREQITSAVHLVIQADRLPGGERRVTHITEIVGIAKSTIMTQDLFVFRQAGVNAAGKSVGQFLATGVATRFRDRFRSCGMELPPDMFRDRVLAVVG